MLANKLTAVLGFLGFVFIMAGSFDIMNQNTAIFLAIVLFVGAGALRPLFSSQK